jgi:hypothetical protein
LRPDAAVAATALAARPIVAIAAPVARPRTAHQGVGEPKAGVKELRVRMTHRWRETDSNLRFRCARTADSVVVV